MAHLKEAMSEANDVLTYNYNPNDVTVNAVRRREQFLALHSAETPFDAFWKVIIARCTVKPTMDLQRWRRHRCNPCLRKMSVWSIAYVAAS